MESATGPLLPSRADPCTFLSVTGDVCDECGSARVGNVRNDDASLIARQAAAPSSTVLRRKEIGVVPSIGARSSAGYDRAPRDDLLPCSGLIPKRAV